MKKSTLRKLIRESIQQLNEQWDQGPWHKWEAFDSNGNPSTIAQIVFIDTNVWDGDPSHGDVFHQNVGSPTPGTVVGWNQTYGPAGYGCYKYHGVVTDQIPTISIQSFGMQVGSHIHHPDVQTCNASGVWTGTGQSGPCPACNSSAWANFTSWTNAFTAFPPFTSSDPNQPCKFICKKQTIWTNRCATVTDQDHKNRLACKIGYGNSLKAQHGCYHCDYYENLNV